MTAADQIGKLRRAYRALCAGLGMDEETRHAMNRSVCGFDSSTHFSLTDWRDVVAFLQRQAGQDVQPGRPHIRSGRSDMSNPSDGWRATAAQVALIEQLASNIHWRVSLAAFIRGRVLPLPVRNVRWSGRLADLSQAEATQTIIVLRRMLGLHHQSSAVNDQPSPRHENHIEDPVTAARGPENELLTLCAG
jgi:hypothetical protein